MNEGIYRVLRAMGDGALCTVAETVVRSGQAQSVVREFFERHPTWTERTEGRVRCTQIGLAALAREMVARQIAPEPDTFLDAYVHLSKQRSAAKRSLDQFYATPETVVRRARLLVEQGEQQRGLLCMGDDDLTNVAVALVGTDRSVSVLDIDEDVVSVSQSIARELNREVKTMVHDLRLPLPKKSRGRFGCVFIDPPYTTEGFALFVSRAIDALKADGRLYVCFGASRRASERGLQKQRILSDAGLYVERVIEDFNSYNGAESIGSRSALWIARKTPQTKPLIQGEFTGEIYSSGTP